MKKNSLVLNRDWDADFIESSWGIIDKIARDKYNFQGYLPQFEIVTYEQMMDSSVAHGLPISFDHWTHGKDYLQYKGGYLNNEEGLPYEMIINTNPSICYLLETNSTPMQLLVLAHAAVGHNHFFKHNYLFKEWTDASTIVDYMIESKKYIKKCEERYGEETVETVLDVAYALMNYSFFHRKPNDFNLDTELAKLRKRLEYEDSLISDPHLYTNKEYEHRKQDAAVTAYELDCLVEDSGQYQSLINRREINENLLYHLARNGNVPKFVQEIFNISCTVAQYFYPQMKTKMINEGFASWCHHSLMYDLYDKNYIHEGYMLEALHSHTSVCNQHQKEMVAQINPYKIGFTILKDLERVCKEPDEEDKRYFPHVVGHNFVDILHDIVNNYNDETVISQFLGPKVARKMRLFTAHVGEAEHQVFSSQSKREIEFSGTHSDEGFLELRSNLSNYYNIHNRFPKLTIRSTKEGCTITHHRKSDKDTLNVDEVQDMVDLLNLVTPVKLISSFTDTGVHKFKTYESKNTVLSRIKDAMY